MSSPCRFAWASLTELLEHRMRDPRNQCHVLGLVVCKICKTLQGLENCSKQICGSKFQWNLTEPFESDLTMENTVSYNVLSGEKSGNISFQASQLFGRRSMLNVLVFDNYRKSWSLRQVYILEIIVQSFFSHVSSHLVCMTKKVWSKR